MVAFSEMPILSGNQDLTCYMNAFNTCKLHTDNQIVLKCKYQQCGPRAMHYTIVTSEPWFGLVTIFDRFNEHVWIIYLKLNSWWIYHTNELPFLQIYSNRSRTIWQHDRRGFLREMRDEPVTQIPGTDINKPVIILDFVFNI